MIASYLRGKDPSQKIAIVHDADSLNDLTRFLEGQGLLEELNQITEIKKEKIFENEKLNPDDLYNQLMDAQVLDAQGQGSIEIYTHAPQLWQMQLLLNGHNIELLKIVDIIGNVVPMLWLENISEKLQAEVVVKCSQ